MDRFTATLSEIAGPKCDVCGQCGCGCEDDDDPRSYRQRVADAKAEMRGEIEDER